MDSFCTYYDFFVHLKLIPTQQQRKKTPFTYNSTIVIIQAFIIVYLQMQRRVNSEQLSIRAQYVQLERGVHSAQKNFTLYLEKTPNFDKKFKHLSNWMIFV